MVGSGLNPTERCTLKKHSKPITDIVLHWTQSSPSTPLAVARDAIDKDHLGRGWGGIGYHYLFDLSGEWVHGRDVRYRGAHVARGNDGRIGIAILSRGAIDPPAFAFCAGLVRFMEMVLWNELWSKGIQMDINWRFALHHQLSATNCGKSYKFAQLANDLNRVYNRD